MNEIFITVNGVGMTEKEYKEYRSSKVTKTAKKSKAKKVKKEISALSFEISNMIKHLTILKSLSAYYDHAYRQWGTIANTIFGFKYISKPFTFYRVKVHELEKLMEEIEKMAKRNEKAAYQFVEKIAWKLDDIKKDINDIRNGVDKSGVSTQFASHEAINGKGRRLGLQTLMNRSFMAIAKIEQIIDELKKIVDNGVDVMNVGAHMSPRSRARCWA